jgi:hypothetical protein
MYSPTCHKLQISLWSQHTRISVEKKVCMHLLRLKHSGRVPFLRDFFRLPAVIVCCSSIRGNESSNNLHFNHATITTSECRSQPSISASSPPLIALNLMFVVASLSTPGFGISYRFMDPMPPSCSPGHSWSSSHPSPSLHLTLILHCSAQSYAGSPHPQFQQ